MAQATFSPILGLIGLFVLEFRAGTEWAEGHDERKDKWDVLRNVVSYKEGQHKKVRV